MLFIWRALSPHEFQYLQQTKKQHQIERSTRSVCGFHFANAFCLRISFIAFIPMSTSWNKEKKIEKMKLHWTGFFSHHVRISQAVLGLKNGTNVYTVNSVRRTQCSSVAHFYAAVPCNVIFCASHNINVTYSQLPCCCCMEHWLGKMNNKKPRRAVHLRWDEKSFFLPYIKNTILNDSPRRT